MQAEDVVAATFVAVPGYPLRLNGRYNVCAILIFERDIVAAVMFVWSTELSFDL